MYMNHINECLPCFVPLDKRLVLEATQVVELKRISHLDGFTGGY